MSKTTFGVPSMMSETPQWAKWGFRIFILLTTVVTFVIASDPAIPDATKVRIGVYLKAADMFVLGLSKMFGVREVNEDFGKPAAPNDQEINKN